MLDYDDPDPTARAMLYRAAYGIARRLYDTDQPSLRLGLHTGDDDLDRLLELTVLRVGEEGRGRAGAIIAEGLADSLEGRQPQC
jgi:hypothetical protein